MELASQGEVRLLATSLRYLRELPSRGAQSAAAFLFQRGRGTRPRPFYVWSKLLWRDDAKSTELKGNLVRPWSAGQASKALGSQV